jgi:hypothetical protein
MVSSTSALTTNTISPSKLCGSGGNTLKFFWAKSEQSRSGGGLLIQKSGYAGSQLLELPVPDLIFAAVIK